MLVIQDEEVANQLRKIAEQEHRPVDDVLKSVLAEYSAKPHIEFEREDALQKYRAKLYAKARQYWEETGNQERLALTDAELDEQFWIFDADDIPRLKSERDRIELPPGSGVHLAEVARQLPPYEGELTDIAEHADDILNAEFADYLLKRMKDNNGGE